MRPQTKAPPKGMLLKKMGKKRRPENQGYGNDCPKCGQKMVRFGHPSHWKPRPRQPYYFKFWDRCFQCRHIQHYEAAKVMIETGAERRDTLTAEFREIVGKDYKRSRD